MKTTSKIQQGCMAALLIGLATSAAADEMAIRRSIESTFQGARVGSITQSPVPGFFQVIIGDAVVYSDAEGRYVFDGVLFDTQSKRDLTTPVKEKLSRIDFDKLPMELALKVTKGDGSRRLVTFEDPNCGYCKKLQGSLAGLDNVTIYTFLVPILSADSTYKTKQILCSDDPAKVYHDVMAGTGGLREIKPQCEAPVGKLIALGKSMKVVGTPTIVFEDGTRVPGYMTQAQIEQGLAKAQVAVARK